MRRARRVNINDYKGLATKNGPPIPVKLVEGGAYNPYKFLKIWRKLFLLNSEHSQYKFFEI
jgi:hypothetical protein